MSDPSRRRLAGIVSALLAVGAALAPTARAADRIYWSNYAANSISFANLNGSGGGALPTGAATVFGPMGLAIDSAKGRIYWANWGLGGPIEAGDGKSISFASLNGSGGRTVLIDPAFVNGPHGLAIDPVKRRLYWPNTATNTIASARLNGGGARNLRTGRATVNGPRGVAIDPRTRRIYWANWSGNRISFARLDGNGGSDLPTGAATVQQPEGVALDPVAQRIYWAGFSDAGGISQANLDGSGGGDLATGAATVNGPHGIAIDPVARRIYWANARQNSLAWASLDGGMGGDLGTPGAPAVEPDQPVLLKAPVSGGRPVIRRTWRRGLRCAPGRWLGDLPGSALYRAPARLSYRWTRAARSRTVARGRLLGAARPGRYRCVVTARNAAGETVRGSASRKLEPSAAPGPEEGRGRSR
jgi:DNA-binding beta-propeller fold protein YncE